MPTSTCKRPDWRQTPWSWLLAIGVLMSAANAQTQQTVTEVWVHDIPGPPQGDFWHPASNLLSTIANPANIYPDVMICARALRGGAPACTPLCEHFQGDTKMGGKGKSTECRRPLHVVLPANDAAMQIDAVDAEDNAGRIQVRAMIARVGVTDPTACPHSKPCEMALPKGTLALSFTVQGKPAAASPPGPVAPSASGPTVPSARCTPRRGPYDSIEDAMLRDGEGRQAMAATMGGRIEYGFVILRDRRQPVGGYYLTPVVRSSQPDTTVGRPVMNTDDYQSSMDQAIAPTCKNLVDYAIAGTVHTHPPISFRNVVLSRNFTATDFTVAIKWKIANPLFEKIVMINAADHKVRIFKPEANDEPFGPLETMAIDDSSLPWFSPLWDTYANERVVELTTYP